MNCDWVKPNITLYAFDELEDADRAEVVQHINRCQDCARLAEAEAELRHLMDLREKLEPSASLLAECRMSLAEAIEEEPAPRRVVVNDADASMSRWRDWLSAPFRGLNLQWQAGMAVALLSVGFVSGTFIASRRTGDIAGKDLSQANISSVHSIAMRPDGGLDVSLDTTHRQTIHGTMDDPQIRQVLIAALGDDNSGVRLDSIEQLKNAIESGKEPGLAADPQVRAALLASLRADKNPGVRLKDMEALKGSENDPAVRQGLLRAMMNDSNAGVRIKAIELLSGKPDSVAIRAFQKLAVDDTNSAIRLKSADTLRKWNAPVEIY